MRSQTAIELDVARIVSELTYKASELLHELGLCVQDGDATNYRLVRAYVMDCESLRGESRARPTYQGFLDNLKRYK